MAGNPQYIPLLIGLGLDDLSMNPVALLEAKKAVRSMEYGQWEGIAQRALQLSSAEDINKLLNQFLPFP
jgi:phosphotransferase system enzyme I (PtsI)